MKHSGVTCHTLGIVDRRLGSSGLEGEVVFPHSNCNSCQFFFLLYCSLASWVVAVVVFCRPGLGDSSCGGMDITAGSTTGVEGSGA